MPAILVPLPLPWCPHLAIIVGTRFAIIWMKEKMFYPGSQVSAHHLQYACSTMSFVDEHNPASLSFWYLV